MERVATRIWSDESRSGEARPARPEFGLAYRCHGKGCTDWFYVVPSELQEASSCGFTTRVLQKQNAAISEFRFKRYALEFSQTRADIEADRIGVVHQVPDPEIGPAGVLRHGRVPVKVQESLRRG